MDPRDIARQMTIQEGGRERKPTNIVVQALDLTDFKNDGAEWLRQQHPEKAIGLTEVSLRHEPWGYIDTASGYFIISNEGIILAEPLESEPAAYMEFYGEYERDGKRTSDMFPFAAADVPVDQLLSKPKVGEPVNLAEFVRTFGARLESNYNNIREKAEAANKIEGLGGFEY